MDGLSWLKKRSRTYDRKRERGAIAIGFARCFGNLARKKRKKRRVAPGTINKTEK